MDGVATPAIYSQRIERDGVEVFVQVGVAASYPDVDELAEIVAHAASVTSSRVHDSIGRASLAEPF